MRIVNGWHLPRREFRPHVIDIRRYRKPYTVHRLGTRGELNRQQFLWWKSLLLPQDHSNTDKGLLVMFGFLFCFSAPRRFGICFRRPPRSSRLSECVVVSNMREANAITADVSSRKLDIPVLLQRHRPRITLVCSFRAHLMLISF